MINFFTIPIQKRWSSNLKQTGEHIHSSEKTNKRILEVRNVLYKSLIY